MAYGIIFNQENSFQLQPEPYSFGYEYDFAALFEAVPGITLSVFNALSEPNDLHNMDSIEDLETFKDVYVITASIALHLALADFTQSDTFKKLIRHSPTHFFLHQHDCLSQPVFVAE